MYNLILHCIYELKLRSQWHRYKKLQVKIIEINRNVGCGEAKLVVHLLCLFCVNYCFAKIRCKVKTVENSIILLHINGDWREKNNDELTLQDPCTQIAEYVSVCRQMVPSGIWPIHLARDQPFRHHIWQAKKEDNANWSEYLNFLFIADKWFSARETYKYMQWRNRLINLYLFKNSFRKIKLSVNRFTSTVYTSYKLVTRQNLNSNYVSTLSYIKV